MGVLKSLPHRMTRARAVGLFGGFKALPSLTGRSTSHALEDTGDTPLGRAVAPRAAAHPGRSGIFALPDAKSAFAARILLAKEAERSLDVQYYIWHNDMAGTLLFNALRHAAERGVRVRLLLDDNNTAGLDETLAALDAHPNIEVRLFNPFALRGPRWFGYLTNFSRLNRRMHNKSFTADNQATIIGGRNVGDEYFDATRDVAFVDLDVIAIGPVVDHVSRDFDRYWSSASAYPVGQLLPPADPESLSRLSAQAESLENSDEAQAYIEAVRNTPFVHDLIDGRLPLEWAETTMVSDEPSKGLGQQAEEVSLSHQLITVLGEPTQSIDLISAYFVPSKTSTDTFVELARHGVRVRILTNALEATDVPVVHAGYAKHRKRLLEAGVELYELKRRSSQVRRNKSAGPFGSSGASLHAKTFAIDSRRAFVGSFNFDPRSARLNTELGFVIDSPLLAQRIENAFGDRIPTDAYEVRLSDKGDLYWLERGNGQRIRHDKEPGTGFLLRLGVRFMSRLPIEWLL